MKKLLFDEGIQKIQESVQESLKIKERFFAEQIDTLTDAFEAVVSTFKKGGKLLIIGNGGSAADAQHLAAEFVNRYHKNRDALPAIALTTDTSILTSIGNDSDFRYIFSRQIEALGKSDDILVAITTSGNSENILEGLQQAKIMGISTLVLTGSDGGNTWKVADFVICVSNSKNTPRIQETLLLIEHLLCEWVEWRLFM
jgi:D-sedoheptulose 7-phosphate isomerase